MAHNDEWRGGSAVLANEESGDGCGESDFFALEVIEGDFQGVVDSKGIVVLDYQLAKLDYRDAIDFTV